MQHGFGSGTLTGVRTDVANSTPAVFGVLQDMQTDFDYTLKELTGQYQAPVAIRRANLKITCKAKSARIYSQIYNSLFFGQTLAAGLLSQALNEAGSVSASSTYTVTVANSATFVTDLGVFYATTGVQFTRVASTPVQGQYSVVAGVYTFAAADASASVLLNYTYTANTGGNKITLTNQLMGAGPTFQMNYTEIDNGKVFNLQFNSCTSSKLSLPFKNTDFMISEFDFEAFADASGTIGYLSMSE